MTFARRIGQGISIVILLAPVSVTALANQSPTLVSRARKPMCCCHCDHAAGARQCTKMCELPQYENRWWATSCHKKGSSAEAVAPHDSNSHSKKTNRTEQAHR